MTGYAIRSGDGQSVKKLLFPLEIGFQGGKEKAFPEAAGDPGNRDCLSAPVDRRTALDIVLGAQFSKPWMPIGSFLTGFIMWENYN